MLVLRLETIQILFESYPRSSILLAGIVPGLVLLFAILRDPPFEQKRTHEMSALAFLPGKRRSRWLVFVAVFLSLWLFSWLLLRLEGAALNALGWGAPSVSAMPEPGFASWLLVSMMVTPLLVAIIGIPIRVAFFPPLKRVFRIEFKTECNPAELLERLRSGQPSGDDVSQEVFHCSEGAAGRTSRSCTATIEAGGLVLNAELSVPSVSQKSKLLLMSDREVAEAEAAHWREYLEVRLGDKLAFVSAKRTG